MGRVLGIGMEQLALYVTKFRNKASLVTLILLKVLGSFSTTSDKFTISSPYTEKVNIF